MAKDYGKKRSNQRRGGGIKQLMVVLLAFICGYLSAAIYDFKHLSVWLQQQILAKGSTTIPSKPNMQAQLPKPKFEFYTLLANDGTTHTIQAVEHPTVPTPTTPTPAATETPVASVAKAASTTAQNNLTAVKPSIQVPAPVVAAVPLPAKKTIATPTAATKELFLVQVAAYRNRQDAEHLKAALALKGFSVSVAAVAQQHVTWFRVLIGPFSNKAQALKAQSDLAKSAHVTGMLRKMGT